MQFFGAWYGHRLKSHSIVVDHALLSLFSLLAEFFIEKFTTKIAEFKLDFCRHFSAPTTSTRVTSSSETSTPFPTRIVFPLKPLRTTTPMPTSINPLLRFYPQEGASKEEETEDENDKLEDGYYWDETRTKKVGKHNTRSSPMSDRWMKDGMSTAASRYGIVFVWS